MFCFTGDAILMNAIAILVPVIIARVQATIRATRLAVIVLPTIMSSKMYCILLLLGYLVLKPI